MLQKKHKSKKTNKLQLIHRALKCEKLKCERIMRTPRHAPALESFWTYSVTLSEVVMMMASPDESNWGRPARPKIWW
jgi:hypothetical protein